MIVVGTETWPACTSKRFEERIIRRDAKQLGERSSKLNSFTRKSIDLKTC